MPHLRALSVVLTAGCNLRCAYCYQDRRPGGRLAWATLRRAVDLLLGSRQRELELGFTGGEPLLAFPLVARAIEYAERRRSGRQRLRFQISTNGLLLDDARADFLARHGVQTQLSFDGVAAAQDLRGRGTFAILDARLDRLRERHPVFFADDLTIAMTLSGASLAHLAESVDYFLGKDVRTLAVAPRYTHDPEWQPERIGELDAQFARVLRSSRRHYERTGRVPLALFRRNAHERPPPPRAMCRLGRNGALAVDADGQVVGCAPLAESYQGFSAPLLHRLIPSLRLGKLGDRGLPARLAAYPRAVRAAGIFGGKADKYSSYGRCRDCRYLRECVVCPVAIAHIPGNTDPHRVPDLPCAFNRVALEYRARFPPQRTALERLRRGRLAPELARRIEELVRLRVRQVGSARPRER